MVAGFISSEKPQRLHAPGPTLTPLLMRVGYTICANRMPPCARPRLSRNGTTGVAPGADVMVIRGEFAGATPVEIHLTILSYAEASTKVVGTRVPAGLN